MKKLGVVLLSVFFVISIAINIYLLVRVIPLLQFGTKLKKAILQCIGQPEWTSQRQISESIPTFKTEYDPDFALYGLTLLHNFELATATKHSFLFPTTLEHIENIGSENICCVLQDKKSKCFWVLFRGTQTQTEMKTNMDFVQKNNVHRGFSNLFQSFQSKLHQIIGNETCVLIGHSLGGALATLAITSLEKSKCVAYVFGSPRVGNVTFHDRFRNSDKSFYNIQNTDDIVTNLPLAVMPNLKDVSEPLYYQHVGKEIYFSQNWMSWLNNHLIPVYARFLEDQINNTLPASASNEHNTNA